MILLLGGTSETRPLAEAIAALGYDVLVSTATDEPLDLGSEPRIARRQGRLDQAALTTLLAKRDIQLIVDATHPYATAITELAFLVAKNTGVNYLRYARPIGQYDTESVHLATTHEQAAHYACGLGKTVLLTTGANHLLCYVREAKARGVELYARILPRAESLQLAHQAGLDDTHVLSAKGPFDVTTNLEHIRQTHAGVLVTKESGQAGGLQAKLQAATQEDCRTVLIQRPMADVFPSLSNQKDLLKILSEHLCLPKSPSGIDLKKS